MGMPKLTHIASMTSSIGACITYLWPGPTPRSMYRCHTAQTIITMLSEPQFVIDDRTRTTETPSTSTTATESTTLPNQPGQTTDGSPPPVAGEGGGSNNVGAIVGGVVGGVAGIALIAGLIAFLLIRQRNKNANSANPQAYSAVAPGDTSYLGAGGMAQPTGYPPMASPPMSSSGYLTPATIAATLNSSAPPHPGMYDPRQSYYKPQNMEEYQQQHGTPSPVGYPAYSNATPPQGAAYPAPHQPVSELDNTNVAAGQQGNPVEIGVNSPIQR